MNYRLSLFAAVVAGLALLFAPTSAQAAKGQKKKPAGAAEAEHRIHGEILEVKHEKGKKGKEHAILVVRTEATKKKNTTAAGKVAKVGKVGKGKKSNECTFTVSVKTEVFIDHGKKKKTHATIERLKVGDHVSILDHDGHADVVDIHEGGKKVANVAEKPKKNK